MDKAIKAGGTTPACRKYYSAFAARLTTDGARLAAEE
jgi:hypothetical protein